ncbi:MAG TPA: 2-oxo-4-hydroxy-4-carboxy-5-ureidoimidazoline decarboxylase [Opitutaceae bacterium]|nr:2-oxo-4-hydroxy-4-carboxy-5-ureidoimidazoline decarboxylase [Opitutaceae bacterium]
MTLPELNAAGPAAFVAALGSLFEHSPWVAEAARASRPFADARDLHAQLCAAMRAAPRERRLALIRAHPNLAARLTQLTAASQGEQADAGLDRLAPAELDEFRRLNADYQARFGFPFVICARLNAKDAILAAMRERLGRDPAGEEEAALAEIEKIAWLRLEDVLRK